MLTSGVRFSFAVTAVSRARWRVLVAALCASVTACSGEKPAPVGTVTSGPLASARAPGPGDPSCPRTGLWQPCALVDRIVHAGLSFKATGDSARVPFFSVPGVRYRVAMTDTMLAFFFADSIALTKAVAPLDTNRMAPTTDTTLPWQARPNVIRSGNLLVLYFAKSPRQIERLKLAITAGAPAK